MRTVNRWLAILAVPVAFATSGLAIPAPALAADAAAPAAKHVVALYTEGPKTTDARELITAALGQEAEVVDPAALKKALAAKGQKLPLGLTISLDGKRGAIVGRIGKATADLGAEVTVIGYTRTRKAGGHEVLLLVIEAGKESPSLEKVVPLGKPDSGDQVKAALAEMTDGWRPAATTTTPTDAPTDAPIDAPAVEPPSNEPPRPENVYGKEIVGVAAAFDLGGRFFSYNDGFSTNLRDYSVFGAPGAAVRAEVYPLATTGLLILRDLGLTGEFRGAFAISSQTKDGTEVDTQWLRFGGGLRFRVPFGPDDKPFVLGARGGFVKDFFTLDATGSLAAEAPSVDYTFLRAGLDGRFPIGPIAITAFGAYLGALDAGDTYTRFRDSSIGGIDVGGGLVVPIALGFEAFVSAEYIRWFYAFAPVPGDAYVAGGALDEYIHLEIGPQYVY